MPASNAARASPFFTGSPTTRIEPFVHGRSPAIASASSRWPFPATPATATSSPARTVSVTPASAGTPRSPSTQTSCSSSTGWLSGRALPCLLTVSISRPTISSASDCGVASAVFAVATVLPPRSTVTRSDTAFTSCSLCEMKTTVLPSSAIRRTVANSASASVGVNTAVGSSRMRMRASW